MPMIACASAVHSNRSDLCFLVLVGIKLRHTNSCRWQPGGWSFKWPGVWLLGVWVRWCWWLGGPAPTALCQLILRKRFFFRYVSRPFIKAYEPISSSNFVKAISIVHCSLCSAPEGVPAYFHAYFAYHRKELKFRSTTDRTHP